MEPQPNGWPLERVLAVAGTVVTSAIAIRAVGGVLSGLGVGSASPSAGLHISQPLYLRIYAGTVWADVASGLALLIAAALVALPRLVWDVPRDARWPGLPVGALIATGVMAACTAIAAGVGTVNWLADGHRFGGPTLAFDVAEGIAAIAVAGLVAVLCSYAATHVAGGGDATN